MAVRAAPPASLAEPMWPSVCVKALRACILGGVAAGASPQALFAQLGVDPALVMDPHARVPHTTIVRAWEEVPRYLESDAFGLKTAELMIQKPFDVIDYVMRQSRTVGDKIERLMRYQRLMHDAADIRLHEDGEQMALSLRFRCQPAPPRHLVEFIVALWVASSRSALGPTHGPEAVYFTHAAPANDSEHRRYFRAPLHFGAEENKLVFSPQVLALEIPQADPALVEVLDRHAQTLLATLPQSTDLLTDLRNLLRTELQSGEPEVQRVAKKLRLSTRSLQRRLKEEGTSFLMVVDLLRRELALRYLEDPALTLTEIGFLLGFVELSSFHRAFRRWTGTTPGQYRKGGARRQEDASS